jgi:hypothetical protein
MSLKKEDFNQERFKSLLSSDTLIDPLLQLLHPGTPVAMLEHL